MEEIWKEYKTYGHNRNNVTWIRSDIQISNFGNVKGNKWNEKAFTKDMIKIVDGRKRIGKYLIYLLVWEIFNGPVPEGYVVHHIDHNKLNDSLSNLMLMTKAEHAKHHHSGTKRAPMKEETKEKIRKINSAIFSTEEMRQKMSKLLKGHKNCLGYHQSEEHKRKQSESKKGRRFWNNGSINVFTKECPDGFRAGRIKKT